MNRSLHSHPYADPSVKCRKGPSAVPRAILVLEHNIKKDRNFSVAV